MALRLTTATPTTDKSADIVAVVNALQGQSLSIMLQLCHVQAVLEQFYVDGTPSPSDATVAAALAAWAPWDTMDTPTRESTVNTRRATLAGLRTI